MIESAASEECRQDAARIPLVIAALAETLSRRPEPSAGAASRSDDAWRTEVVAGIDDLESCFAAHVVIDEEPEGFIVESEGHAPRLIHALEALRSEHAAIHRRLLGARSAARDRAAVCGAAFADDLAGVLHALEHHLDVDYRLAFEVANSDLGSSE